MVLDAKWILADEVLGNLVDRSRYAAGLAFKGAFRPTLDAGVGCYSDQSGAIPRCVLVNSGNFHSFKGRTVDSGWVLRRCDCIVAFRRFVIGRNRRIDGMLFLVVTEWGGISIGIQFDPIYSKT